MQNKTSDFDNIEFQNTPSVPAGLESAESKDIIDYLYIMFIRLFQKRYYGRYKYLYNNLSC